MPRLIVEDSEHNTVADIYIRGAEQSQGQQMIIIRWYSDKPIENGDSVVGSKIENVLLGLARIGKEFAPTRLRRETVPQGKTDEYIANPATNILKTDSVIIHNMHGNQSTNATIVLRGDGPSLYIFKGDEGRMIQRFYNSEMFGSIPGAPGLAAIRALISRKQQTELKDFGSAKDGGKGGIDFRALPMSTRAVEAVSVTGSHNMPIAVDPKAVAALEKEWHSIQQEMQKGRLPYKEIKEYVVSCNKEQAREQIDQVLACVANILRLEEDAAVATPPELKEILTTIG